MDASRYVALVPDDFKRQLDAEHTPSLSITEIEKALNETCHLTRTNGGATYSLSEGSLLGRELFAVAIAPERTITVPGLPEPEEIRHFVLTNLELLQNPNYCIGTWFDQRYDRTSLDLSVAIPNRELALRFAEAGRQDAIYDLKGQKEIFVKEARAAA